MTQSNLIKGIVVGAGVLLGLLFSKTPFAEKLDFLFFDFAQRNVPVDGDPHSVVVALDEQTFETFGWPLGKDVYAALTVVLHEAGAKKVGLDLFFTDRFESYLEEEGTRESAQRKEELLGSAVAATDPTIKDVGSTPQAGNEPLVMVHVNRIEALDRGITVVPVPRWIGWAAATFVSFVAEIFFRRVIPLLAAAFLCAVASFVAVFFLYTKVFFFLPVSSVLFPSFFVLGFAADEATDEAKMRRALDEILKKARERVKEKAKDGADKVKTAHVAGRKADEVVAKPELFKLLFWDEVR